MSNITLSALSTGLGLIYALPHAYGLFNPAGFAATMRRFPRYTPIGVVLTLAATAWFLYYLSLETVADFANIKTILYFFFGAVGLGTCLFVRDFLPVRGLAVLLLLSAKLMVDTGRPRLGDTSWVLIIQIWAYAWALAGMWLTISPWRLRDLINWATASEQRTRLISGLRLAFGVFVIVLGLTVFK